MTPDKTQQFVDAFYRQSGKPCCAGCDWWRCYNVVVGECTKSAPVPSDQRLAKIGINWASLVIGAGHVMTLRHHECGDFKDTFDWKIK